ncbi:MAG: hypothetical protein L0Z55_03870 [Planctomycetes bacterium]|nr:hypothetical protein [Planctomycetota bacterium]
MTVPRTTLVAALVFACGFDLAVQGLLGQGSMREIVELRAGLANSLEARDRAQDSYDAAVYAALFETAAAASAERPAREVVARPREAASAEANSREPRSRRGT